MRRRYIQNDILVFLADNKVHTAREISGELNIGISTVYRHVRDLSIDYPIIMNRAGEFRGIKLLSNAFISKYFTVKEITFLMRLTVSSDYSDKEKLLNKLSGLLI